MTSKIPQEKIPYKNFKLHFKFVFLTKKFKEKNQCNNIVNRAIQVSGHSLKLNFCMFERS
jgi:hypothetical protein